MSLIPNTTELYLTRPGQLSSYSVQGERRERWVPRKGAQGEMLPYLVRNSSFATCYMKTTSGAVYSCLEKGCWKKVHDNPKR